MRRNHKTEEHKRLRHIWKEYLKISDARRSSGEWIDVEPYQQGWIRYFVLREDAKNRKDAREMQQVLDKINVHVYCRNDKFEARNWKTGKFEPIQQRLKHLTEQQYDALTEKQKSFFVKSRWVETVMKKGFKERVFITGYTFRDDFYLVFHIEPNMVAQHWIPNQELESLYGEMSTRMERQNLWAKLNKAMHWNTGHNRGWKETIPHRYRNSNGFEFEDVVI